MYIRDLVTFGFLTEVRFVLFNLLDTELGILVTLFLERVIVFGRSNLLCVETLFVECSFVTFKRLVDLVGVVTLVLESVSVTLSEARLILFLVIVASAVLVDLVGEVALRVTLVVALLSLNLVALVVAIEAFARLTRVLAIRSLLFLGC